MPPSANAASTSLKSKTNRFSPSPDSEPIVPELLPSISSKKKKKKDAASKQAQNLQTDDRASTPDVARPDSPPPPPSRPQTILSQLGHGFALPNRSDSPLLDLQDGELATSEKVSDQYTPPNDTWLQDEVLSKPPPPKPTRVAQSASPIVGPGFSTRARYDSKSPPISPPIRYARPVSYGGGIPPVPSLPRGSPSAYSYTPGIYGSPPAPHLPQPHFYHAQDVNLGLPPGNMPSAREDPVFVRHARLPSKNGVASQAVIRGYEGKLDVLRLENNNLVDEIGALEGLSGTVIDAVLLDWRSGHDPFAALRPLVAVVVHGPKEQYIDGKDGMPIPSHNIPARIEYSTRVEVLSLSTQQRLVVLLETPVQASQAAFRGAPPTPPSPIGQIMLQASGVYLTVSSGASGEVYAFTVSNDPHPGFECLGKFWTSIQPQAQRRDSSRHQLSDVDLSPADLGRATNSRGRAILSLGGRWLAICPPSPPSASSIGAQLGDGVVCARHIGIETTSAPARPSVTCEVESPDADTLFGKVARGVAQEFVKGARWLGDQGYQTWQSYWRKDSSPSSTPSSAYTSPPLQPALYAANAFPPTHGEAQHNSKEPELVTLYDLEALNQLSRRRGGDEAKPLATFQPPGGCSFLSLAPQGLNLLTASRKGDVQYVWNLLQVRYCRLQAAPTDDEKGRSQPRVRQVAKYERLSTSTIVDVIWDRPAGSRFAILTKNKTIHLFDLASSAFRWPPPRRPLKLRPSSRSMDTTQHEIAVASGFFASALNIANQAQPMIANWRGRAPSMSGGLAGIGQTSIGLASATGVRGGKAVAAGLSKSLGAATETMTQIRHAGESRLHLKSNKEALAGKIFWNHQGRSPCLGVLETDSIKLYQVRRTKIQDRRDRDSATVFAARKAAVIKLSVSSRFNGDGLPPEDHDAHQDVITGFWKARPLSSSGPRPLAHPLSFAEIETNAPYQPFHSDRRVTLSFYSKPGVTTAQTSSVVLSPRHKLESTSSKSSSKLMFGDDISVVTLNVGKIQVLDNNEENTGSVIYRETVKVTSSTAEDDEMDQIVSTTRRRKVKKDQAQVHSFADDGGKDDGFFEDDCDVLDFAADRV